jgi:hypothetical protein
MESAPWDGKRPTRRQKNGKKIHPLKENIMGQNSGLCHIATSVLLLFSLLLPVSAQAGVGTVTHLSGPLFGKKADGSSRALSVNSAVEQGDTLVTEKRTYGRVKFIDGGEVTLRPGTVFVVESYLFDKSRPADDKAVLGLVKGSLRAVTGQVSKRGNPNAYKLKTSAATIGVRGTSYDLKICQDNCPGLENGIYFTVIEGMIEVSNKGGTLTFGPGSYGFVRDENSIPVLLPYSPKLDFDLFSFGTTGSAACGVR